MLILILFIFQTAAIFIIYRYVLVNYILQSKHNHPHIFHNRKVALFLVVSPWLLITLNIVLTFLFTDFGWLFFFLSVVMFIAMNSISRKPNALQKKIKHEHQGTIIEGPKIRGKTLIGVTTEQFESNDPKLVIDLLTDMENQNIEELKLQRGKVSLFINGKDLTLKDTSKWSINFCTQYDNFAYFLDIESIAFVRAGYLQILVNDSRIKNNSSEKLQKRFFEQYTNLAIALAMSAGYTKEDMIEYWENMQKDLNHFGEGENLTKKKLLHINRI